MTFLTISITLLAIAIAVIVPLAWLVAEARRPNHLRTALGVATIAIVVAVTALVVRIGTGLEYNAWHGTATANLLRASIDATEDGHVERVVSVWRGLERRFHPTYENRGRYKELVEDATRQIRGDETNPDALWEDGPFSENWWYGHWEAEHGIWYVISDLRAPCGVSSAGMPPMCHDAVDVAADFSLITFGNDTHTHQLRLLNKYEAEYQVLDRVSGNVESEETLHKLIRATPTTDTGLKAAT